ncbi:hypothetical protein FIBSPDRAFT_1055929 [Athelia psychrophila]|uniref:BTB domain-containing protein n=1 Tax=Athelia psychrophila TaxID=1759441 RepID=A0A167SY58_9AGAM|nr:hypothetical protein FIBSPDRAFT_1055929 [Fibularhizoctonia sp. CBS 109695]
MSSIITSAPPSPSLVSFGSSRASAPLDSNELEQPAVQANIDPEAKATRHSHWQYHFKDGNVVFLIEEVLYNVHRYFFERDSTHFRSALENDKEPTNRTQSCCQMSAAATLTNFSPFFIPPEVK